MNQKIAKRYIEIAKAMKPKMQTGKSFHVTCIFDKSKLLSIATNDYSKEHRRHRFGKYHPLKGGSKGYTPGCHSEIAAILKLGEQDCSKYTFFNIRIGNNGEPSLSKPCSNCFRVLEMVGFKRIYYTSKDSIMVCS